MDILKKLFKLLTPYWKTLIFSALLLIGRAGLELVPPLFQRNMEVAFWKIPENG